MFLPANARRRTALLLAVLLALLVLATQGFSKNDPQPPPKAFHARTYPAVDTHSDEHAAIAADPFDMPDKMAFMVVPYKDNDILPIRVIISNDSDAPLNLSRMQVQL